VTYTLVYVSTLSKTMSDGDVEQLLDVSRSNNARHGVTGMLVFRGQRVMQLLEGDEGDVRALFRRISDDPRHTDVVRVWESTQHSRRFPDWSMRFDDLESLSRPLSDDPGWLEVDLSALADAAPSSPLSETKEYVQRRAGVLRRALVSGDRLVTTLAIILHGHRPEAVLEGDAVVHLHCAECRGASGGELDHYPCSTAKNAIWALEAAAR